MYKIIKNLATWYLNQKLLIRNIIVQKNLYIKQQIIQMSTAMWFRMISSPSDECIHMAIVCKCKIASVKLKTLRAFS